MCHLFGVLNKQCNAGLYPFRFFVHRNYFSLIELGKNSPSVRMLYKLCDALDTRPFELLKDADKRMSACLRNDTRGRSRARNILRP